MTIWEPARFAQPRFRRIADLIERIATPAQPSVAAIDDAFAALAGVRFVEAPKTKPALIAGVIDPASLYEVSIVERGVVPTRPHNMHDLLNAVVWAAFPRSKLALTRRLAEIQRARAAGRATLPSARSREHDRLAMIDEGAVLLTRGQTWIFGHAIYEHAYAGELGVRGGAVDLAIDAVDRAAVDRAFAAVEFGSAIRPGPGIAIEDDM